MKDITLTGDNISHRDCEAISEMITEALENMGIDPHSFAWSIEVSVEERPTTRKVNTADLMGRDLDRVVASIHGVNAETFRLYYSDAEGDGDRTWHYSTDWTVGGPLITQHIALLEDLGDYEWEATAVGGFKGRGSTALQAACIAYVLQQLGPVVEIEIDGESDE